jgi:hypothetical protein
MATPLHLPRQPPGLCASGRWRSAARAAAVLALLFISWPLLWLLGGLAMLGLLAAAMGFWVWSAAVQRWRARPAPAERWVRSGRP